MMIRPLLTTLLAAFLLSPAAQAQGHCLENVWLGAIDDTPIEMTFGPWLGAEGQLAGRYHAGINPEDNFLLPDQAIGGWQAVNSAGVVLGTLTLECALNQSLHGTWRTADGRLSLPLTGQVAPSGYYGIIDVAVETISTSRSGNAPYAVIGIAGVANRRSLRFLGEAAEIGHINIGLEAHLTSAYGTALQCRALRWLKDRTQLAIPRYEDELVMLNQDFAVILKHRQRACEQDYMSGEEQSLTIDLNTGQQQHTVDWLVDPDAIIASQYEVASERATYAGTLSQLLWQAYRHPNPECSAQVTFTLEDRQIYPTAQGLVFLPFAGRDFKECVQAVTLPYRDILPFMSALGRQRVQAILAALPR